jgi:hypothetical protein
MVAVMISIPDVDAAPASVLRVWWAADLHPGRREGDEVDERLAIRCEALGLVTMEGKLK